MLIAGLAASTSSWGADPVSLAAAHHDRAQRATPRIFFASGVCRLATTRRVSTSEPQRRDRLGRPAVLRRQRGRERPNAQAASMTLRRSKDGYRPFEGIRPRQPIVCNSLHQAIRAAKNSATSAERASTR